MAKTFIAFGDTHFPYQNDVAIEVIKKVIAHVKPDKSVCTGDLLSCDQFSRHPATHGMMESELEDDLRQANTFIDHVQKHTKEHTALIEGNHEYRIDLWAGATTQGRGAYSMLAPRINLARGRKKFSYAPYGSLEGKIPHYKINRRIHAVHGWSYAVNAVKKHMSKACGVGMIHGHTHRLEYVLDQNPWTQKSVFGVSTGCLCGIVPIYGTGSPTSWSNGFVIGFLGRHSDTVYPCEITGNSVVLPSGKEITV